MNNPISRLAILNCLDPKALLPLLKEVSSTIVLKGCISKADNLCYVVEGNEDLIQKIYKMLNGIKIENGNLDCRYVDNNYVWKEEVVIEEEVINKSTVSTSKKEEQEELGYFDLTDKRFNALYTDSDFIIDTSHPEYKRSKLLKYLLEERRRRVKDTNKME